MFNHWEIRIYWHMRNGNKKLVKRFWFEDKPTGDEVTRVCSEYAADSVDVVRV